MSTFTKWNKLPSELREHSLSYCYTKELGKYAQLSHLCNNDIQKLNSIAPKYLSIKEFASENVGIMVRVKYHLEHTFDLFFVTAGEDTHKIVRNCLPTGLHGKLDDRQTLEGNVRQAALKYLEKLLKYTNTTKIKKLVVNCKVWPFEEMSTIPAIFKVSDWKVTTSPSMCHIFINLMYKTTNVKKLHLETNYSTFMPSGFFESNFFKQLEHADLNIQSNISDFDFLASKAHWLRLKCDSVTDRAINKKLRQWYKGEIELNNLQISLGFGGFGCFNTTIVLLGLPRVNNPKGIRIHRLDGKVGLYSCSGSEMMFSVS